MIYPLLRFSLKLLSYIPFRVMYILSDGMYYLLYYVVRYRRKVVRQNLVGSFPGKDPKEIRRIEKNFYRFFMDMISTAIPCGISSCNKYNAFSRMISDAI